MPKRPHGLLGLREAEYRVANPGQWRKRRPINTRWEQAVRAWMVVLVSDEVQHQDLSPWDVLLMSVRLAWLRVLEVEDQLNALKRNSDGDMDDPAVRRFLQESRRERVLAAKASKAAIDAGVAERLVRQAEFEGEILVRTLARVLDAAQLPEEWRVWFHSAIHEALLTAEQPDARPQLPAPPRLLRSEDGPDPANPVVDDVGCSEGTIPRTTRRARPGRQRTKLKLRSRLTLRLSLKLGKPSTRNQPLTPPCRVLSAIESTNPLVPRLSIH